MAKTTFIILAGSAIIIAMLSIMFLRVSHPRMIVHAVTPDGTELGMVQECNWSTEPYTTSFIYRKPGASWRRFYYDHQDNYWGSARMTLNTNADIAVVYRDNAPTVTFHWDSEIYLLHRQSRTYTNGEMMPANWNPGMSVYPH